jgi:hypothetical protein
MEIANMDVKEVPPFPNPGVRLIKEDEHIAIWEELFEPDKSTEPHRHMRDYIAFFPRAGELAIIPVAEGDEEFTVVAGEATHSVSNTGAIQLSFSDGSIFYQRIPADGSCHYAVNKGATPVLMILAEIKGTGTEKISK